MEYDGVGSKRDMVASLQSRKEALENKLREKNEELKALCIQEAELTGVLPPETPVEPGEDPPVFRRRVRTAFTYPENLINKLKSKEEESLAALELECKIQTGIAEAALGLANDGTASKSVRRKHRLMYQQSQHRLIELEAQLSFLRQSSNNNNNNNNNIKLNSNINVNNNIISNNNNINNKSQLKQRKKPRPPLDSDGDCVDGIDTISHHQQQHQSLSLSLCDRGVLRHSHTYNGSRNYDSHQSHRQAVRSHPNSYHWDYHTSTSPDIRSGSSIGHKERDQGYYHYGNETMWYNTAPNLSRAHHQLMSGHSSNEDDRSISNFRYRDRFGSLDRRHLSSGSGSNNGNRLTDDDGYDEKHAIPNPVPAILLPNQTYPENSLMRTQSLGVVDHVTRRTREKEWFETALDSGTGPPVPSPTVSTTSPPSSPAPPLPPPHSQSVYPPEGSFEPAVVNFDTVVPFESPKNHTVVQAGKWQPYREVTKPFEMADFYKYSTKYRKNNPNSDGAPQHKGMYQPLQPMTCQPILQNSPLPPEIPFKERRELPNTINNANIQSRLSHPHSHPHPNPHPNSPSTASHSSGPSTTSSLADTFSSEILAWYQDHNIPQSRSATLV